MTTDGERVQSRLINLYMRGFREAVGGQQRSRRFEHRAGTHMITYLRGFDAGLGAVEIAKGNSRIVARTMSGETKA